MSTDSAIENALRKFKPETLRNRYAEMVKRGESDDRTGCICVDPTLKATRTGADYVRINISEWNSVTKVQTKVNIFVHQLDFWIHHGRLPDTQFDLSHLCGRPRCFRGTHLIEEAHDVNLTRLCCHKYLGKFEGYICPHEPRCIV